MSTELADVSVDEPPAPTADPPRRRRFALDAKKIRVLSLLAVIVAGQALLMLLFLPAPAEPSPGGDAEALAEGAEGGAAALDLSLVEVPIDEFNTTNSRATPGAIIHVGFRLVAIVAANEREPFSTAVNGSHAARVREAIERVVRSTSLDDLRDPNYVMLKRRIKSDVNKVLRKSYVIEAVIRDFKTIEQ